MGSCVIFGERSPQRDRLAQHLGAAYDELRCVDSVADLLDADEQTPDVLVVDADREMGWLEVLRLVRTAHPSLPVMVIGGSEAGGERDPRDEPAARALRMGARGFLRAGDLADPAAPPPAMRPGTGRRRTELSAREMDVLKGMTEGRSNAEIAADLVLAEDTIKTHARRLFRKLGAGDRADAVARGFRQGLLR